MDINITSKKTRCSLCKEQEEKCIIDLLSSQFHDREFAGRPLYATVPTKIIIRSVLILLSVFFIMFLIIRNQIIQSETCLSGDIIKGLFLF